jgi:uncharacterized tellurite resistance protein B-like protein
MPSRVNSKYQLGLLCLTHLLICADGEVNDFESDAIGVIKKKEKISQAVQKQFQKIITTKKEREIYEHGINLINQCTDEEKMKVFVTLFKLSEVDGRVHVKEIRLLLFSIKLAGVEFNDVVNKALASPSLI